MFNGSLDYTICSIDPKSYNRINCNLISPMTKYGSFIVTSLTLTFNIVVLDTQDYFVIKELFKKDEVLGGDWGFIFDDEEDEDDDCGPDEIWIIKRIRISKIITAVDRASVFTLLKLEVYQEFEEKITDDDNDNVNSSEMNEYSKYSQKNFILDESNRLVMRKQREWKITEMSYNLRLIMGFYNTEFPVYSEFNFDTGTNDINAESVGFMMSTPILYLISNVGIQSYRNVDEDRLSGAKIVMRINNSYVSDTPIITNNGDFRTTILSNDLSMLEFKLVDANLHEIHLLSPMYLTLHVDSVEDEKIVPELLVYNKMHEEFKEIGRQKNNQENEEENEENDENFVENDENY